MDCGEMDGDRQAGGREGSKEDQEGSLVLRFDERRRRLGESVLDY